MLTKRFDTEYTVAGGLLRFLACMALALAGVAMANISETAVYVVVGWGIVVLGVALSWRPANMIAKYMPKR